MQKHRNATQRYISHVSANWPSTRSSCCCGSWEELSTVLKRTLAAKKDSAALFAVQGAETAISTVTVRQYVTRIFFYFFFSPHYWNANKATSGNACKNISIKLLNSHPRSLLCLNSSLNYQQRRCQIGFPIKTASIRVLGPCCLPAGFRIRIIRLVVHTHSFLFCRNRTRHRHKQSHDHANLTINVTKLNKIRAAVVGGLH